MNTFDIIGVVACLVSVFESGSCIYSTLRFPKASDMEKKMLDLQQRLEETQRSLRQLEEQPLVETNIDELTWNQDPTKSVATLRERLCCARASLNHSSKSVADFLRHLSRDQKHIGHTSTKCACASWVRTDLPLLSHEYMDGKNVSEAFVHRKLLTRDHSEIKGKGMEEKPHHKLPYQPLRYTQAAGGCKCECMHQAPGRTRQFSTSCNMSATRVIRLAGGIFMLYPVCMLIMGNYAMNNGSFEGYNSCVGGKFWLPQDANFHQAVGSEVKQSITVPGTLADISQGISVAQITPRFVSEPSAPVFLVASMTWAFLEWAHYQSNVNNRYQIAIFGVASIVGILPALGCATDMLTVLLCTLPLAIHVGLLASDVLHRARQDPRPRDGGTNPRDPEPRDPGNQMPRLSKR
jgi:hypothetical protein